MFVEVKNGITVLAIIHKNTINNIHKNSQRCQQIVWDPFESFDILKE